MSKAFLPGYDHDVFVSYGHVDDHPPVGAEDGWVTTLRAELERLLRRKLGLGDDDRVSIFMDALGLSGGERLDRGVPPALLGSAVLLVVLSPRYLASASCQAELAAFLAAGMGAPTVRRGGGE